jgi:hypothetical protein
VRVREKTDVAGESGVVHWHRPYNWLTQVFSPISSRTRNAKQGTQQRRLHRRDRAQSKFAPTVPYLVSQQAVWPLQVLKWQRGGRGGSGRALLALTAAQVPLLQSKMWRFRGWIRERVRTTTMPSPESCKALVLSDLSIETA